MASGSVNHSNTHLNANGFVYSTINHQENYVNPGTGIERVWLSAETKIMKTMSDIPRHTAQAHLDECSWRILHQDANELFLAFLCDGRTDFPLMVINFFIAIYTSVSITFTSH